MSDFFNRPALQSAPLKLTCHSVLKMHLANMARDYLTFEKPLDWGSKYYLRCDGSERRRRI